MSFTSPGNSGKTIQNPVKSLSVPPRHILVGYWHNWDTSPAAFLPLREVSNHFDVINIAFATSSDARDGKIVFAPYTATDARQFRSDVTYLQSLGKKVLISIGGATGSIAIDSSITQDNFVSSVVRIIQEYGFDGMDINLEGKVVLDRGDVDFQNSTSACVKYLAAAIREVRNNFGRDFILSLAPETINVQGGFHSYECCSGSYLPIIYKLRDILTYLQVQHYNSGALTARDLNTYVPGAVDFHVAMTEMLLRGFPVGGNPKFIFPPLMPEQIVIGLAAQPDAVNGGYTSPLEIKEVLDYLARGEAFGGAYQLQNSAGYSSLRGIMTWSINWDAANNYQFSNVIRPCLDALP